MLPGMTGIDLITQERHRHFTLGHDREHDRDHTQDELTRAAALYALPPLYRLLLDQADLTLTIWPKGFPREASNRIRELAKAGALLAAEIDRLHDLGITDEVLEGYDPGQSILPTLDED